MWAITITTRNHSIRRRGQLVLVAAACVLAVPASAAAAPVDPLGSQSQPGGEYATVSSLTGSDAVQSAPSDSQYASVNSLTGSDAVQSAPSDSQYASVNSLMADHVGPPPSDVYRTVNAITGSDHIDPLPTETVASTSPGDGFDWSDAGIGALVALALSVCAAAAVLAARRHSTLTPSA